jgi:VanZ family protein
LKRTKKAHLSMVMKAIWIISVALVSYLSLVPKIEFPINVAGIDKVYHSLAYLWLATVPFLGFRRLRIAFVAASLMIPLGIALEYVQRLMAMGRYFEVGDMIANLIGVLVGVALGMLFKARLSMGFQE